MQPEYEARFLSIDPGKLVDRLQDLGAEQIFPRTLMRRIVLKNNDIEQRGGWLRLRDEGRRVTLTYKQVSDAAQGSSIDSTLEAEIEVSGFDETLRLLEAMAFTPLRFQENYREEWRYKGVTLDIDTWPDLDTYLEVEGPDAQSVADVAATLGFTMDDATYGSVDEVYQSVLGRDILGEDRLVF
jgi:adenylate cyclase class 2